MNDSIVRFEGLSKRFPGVVALDDVTFEIAPGECHAVVGENGAGKSTLGRILAGIHQPSAGRMIVRGRPVVFRSPLEAAAAGVSVVHQELAFCPNLSIAENLLLGRMPARWGCVQRGAMHESARRMLAEVGLGLAPQTPMSELSTAQEQMVQIAAAVGRGARIVIMDEPTSSLSQAEATRLCEVLRRLRSQGVTVIYVSHRLEEIVRVADRVTVLRDGRYVSTSRTADVTPDEIVRMMIGRAVADYFPACAAAPPGSPLLRVERLTARGRFTDVSFEVRRGEIVGLAGLVGSGRSEIARAIFGIDRVDSGRILLDGEAVTIRSPRAAIARGIGLLPEDRKRQGLVLSMTCRENLSLAMLPHLRGRFFLQRRRERATAGEFCARLAVRAPGLDAPVAGLSGGNQQKIALAKWLATHCRVLLLDEPTRGVDVGAKAEIHALIDGLAGAGHAVLLISSELPEILNLSTRILVLTGGRIVGELSRGQADQEKLMRLMAGVAGGVSAG